MSRDIRSFFTGGKAKASGASASTTTITSNKNSKNDSYKPKTVTYEIDSDEEDVKSKPKSGESKRDKSPYNGHVVKNKKRRIIDSSDDEDDKKTSANKNKGASLSSKVAKLSTKNADEKKLKQINVTGVFGNEPVKRTEKEKKPKTKSLDQSLLDADDIDLSSIDDSVLASEEAKFAQQKSRTPAKDRKTDDDKKTPKKEPKRSESNNNNDNKSPKGIKTEDRKASKEHKRAAATPPSNDSKRRKAEKNDEEKSHKKIKSEGSTPSSSKRSKKPSNEDTEMDTSVYDPDQEKAERKRAAAMLYKQFQKRSGPAHPGTKEIPKGKPDCLDGLTFVLTGVYDSLERDEAAAIIRDFGGKVTSALSKKTTHLVAGDEAGPAKIAKAEENGTKVISEDDLLDLIRINSGMAPIHKKVKNEDDKKIKKEKESPMKQEETPQKKAVVEKQEKTPRKRTESEMKKEKTPKEQSVDIKIKKETPEKDEQQKSDAPQVWVEKYKPKTVKEIIGQQGANSNCEKLIRWLSNWHKNQKNRSKVARPNPWAKNDDGGFYKAALLSGPPGVGKTTTAHLVCKQLGFDTIEFNASDTRSKKSLKEQVAELLTNKTLHAYVNCRNETLTEKQVLLMDEVDGMAGNEDRGGMAEFIALIKSSSVPIICMCNDRNHPKIRSLLNYCFDLRFARPRIEQIKSAILSICFKEKIKIPPKVIEEIIAATNHDVRQSINSISLLAARPDMIGGITKTDNGKKDLKLGPWDVIRKVFSAEDHKTMSINDKSDLFFHDYSLAPLFVQQTYLTVAPNVPKSQVMQQVALAADSLSLGDLVDKRIRSQMAWSLLPTQAMFSSVMPGDYMSGRITAQINFPAWLGKNSKTQKRNRLAQELHDHTRLRTSASRQSIRLDYAPFLLKNIAQPMIDDEADGVEEALNIVKEYRLLREDIDSLVELTTWPGKKSIMDSVNGKVKAVLTRAYNKEISPYVYSVVTGVKKKCGGGGGGGGDEDDIMAEIEELEGNEPAVNESDENDEDDDVKHDALIKAKPSTKAGSSKAGTSKASTSKASTSKAGTSKKPTTSKKK